MPRFNLQTELNAALKTFMVSVRASLHAELYRQALVAEKKEANKLCLTLREQNVKALILAGLQNKEIADKLNIETRTVKYHVGNILRKHSVQNRHELAELY
jgi:DNA-binding NarL/FixJ family response regulator